MPELFLSAPALEGIRRLEADASLQTLLLRVNGALDLIERHPDTAEARRLRFVDPPSWGVPVGYRAHSYVVTWMSGEDFESWAAPEDIAALSEHIGDDLAPWVVVLYIGPRPE